MNEINIKGLDKADVLAALYNCARPQGMGVMHGHNSPMTKLEAQEILDSGQTYFDYLKGRVMKIDISGNDVQPHLYDRDNGVGNAQSVIDNLFAHQL